MNDKEMLQLIMSLCELSEEKRKEICILLMSTTLLDAGHIEQTAGYMVGLSDQERN